MERNFCSTNLHSFDIYILYICKVYNCTINISRQVMSDAMKVLQPLCSVKPEREEDKLHDLELIKILI